MKTKLKTKLAIITLLALALPASIQVAEGQCNFSQGGIYFAVPQAHVGDTVQVFPGLGMSGGGPATNVTGSVWIASGLLTNFLVNVTLGGFGPFYSCPADPLCQPGPYNILITPALVGTGQTNAQGQFLPVVSSPLDPTGFFGQTQKKTVRAVENGTGTVVCSANTEQLNELHTATLFIVSPCMQVAQTCAYSTGACFTASGPISFTGYVTNCGDIQLTNVTVVHSRGATLYSTTPPNLPLTLPLSLTNGQKVAFQGSFTPTAADIAAGSAASTITVTGTDTTTIGGPNASVTNSIATSCSICPPAPIADDFSSGNDSAWTRYDALVGAFTNYIPATFAVSNGQYRITIPKPTPNPYGFVRALPYRADQTCTDFEVAADIAAWDNAGGNWFGVIGGMNQIGLNQTSGYLFWYRSDIHVLFLNLLRREAGWSIATDLNLTLDPTHQYRFTLTRIGERMTGIVVDLATPGVVLASMTGRSGLFASGYCGLFAGGPGGADVTFDNFLSRTPTLPPPSLNLSAAPGVGFQPPARYTTGRFPHGLDKGDVNHDGVLDLVVANNSVASVGVFLGQTNGSFTKQADYPVGAGPLSPILAKFNTNTTYPDLVVANGSGTTVSVLLGQANGTLGVTNNFITGSRPTSIAVGDFNKDGLLDLVTANNGSTNVSVLLGNGDGTFQAKTDFPTGKAPLVVRAADLNGDGFLDLVTANNGSGENSISVLLGRGDGTFQDKVSYPAGVGPSSVAIGHFNGDGRLDVAVANRTGNSVMVLPGNGDGTLGAAVSTTFVDSPWDLVVADLNGDSKADLVVTTTIVGHVAVLMGAGDGSFNSSSFLLDLGDNCTDAAVADFNLDNRPDLAVACQFGDRFEVLFNRGTNPVASPAVELSWPLPADGYLLEAADSLSGSWTTVGTGPVDQPGQRRAVDVGQTGDQRYFRLHKP